MEFIQSTYVLLALLGMDPSRVKTNFELEESDTGATISIAFPDTKIGLASEGDTVDEFLANGWYIEKTQIAALSQLHTVLSQFQSLSFEDTRRSLSDTIKQTSQHEDWLLQEIIRRNLPNPDRNYKMFKANGKELTTPDFVWIDAKVAFFVDGLWWHISMDDSHKLDALTDPENRKDILSGRKTRAEKDSTIRSQLSAEGWVVLSCTDRQLETQKGIREQVAQIEQVLKRVSSEQKLLQSARKQSVILESEENTDNGTISIEDLI